jgi:type I restriction enzyme, S subunit
MKQQEQDVPSLRFPEFKGEWSQELLGDYFTFKNGVNADKSAYGHGYKFINVLDIIDDRPIKFENIIGSVSISEKEFEKNKVVYGDILFQRSSETREEVGQSNVYLDKENPATFGGFVIKGHPKKELNSEFFHSLLKTRNVRKDMTSRSGGSTRYNVGQGSLSLVSINVAPTPPEQQKIASFLRAVDEKLEQLTRRKALLQEYKASSMQGLFTQQLRFGDDQGRSFPNWHEKQLGDVLDVVMGQSPSSASYNDVGNGLPLIQGNADVLNRKSNPRRFTTEVTKTCDVGDLLISVRAPIGEISKATLKACIGRGVAAVCAKSGDNEYWYQYLIYCEPIWHRLGQGSTFSAISGADIRGLYANVPHLDEQRKIANFLAAIDTKIDYARRELSATQDFKIGLLQQMFV